jgi:hypothetical protein
MTWNESVSVIAPDPLEVRAASIDELRRLRLPLPPPKFPLVWERGDRVELRPRGDLEARAAVLNVVLARCFGMPPELAMSWLLGCHLVDAVTPPEWHFVVSGQGDHRSFALHLEALFALAWLLGLVKNLDPIAPPDDRLVDLFPDLPEGETFARWRSRTLSAPREPRDAAAMLDLYYCLDWSYLALERRRGPLPGPIDSNAIGQRRWALEWGVVFYGPYHAPPGGWEEVDLS